MQPSDVRDLLIINPGSAHGIYGSDLARSLIAVEPPVWCRIIADYVGRGRYSVGILDAEAEGLDPDATAQRALLEPVRLICVAVYGHQPSASTQQMDAAIKVVRAITRNRPQADDAQNLYRVVIVGGHVAALPERSLEESCADFACTGEGPYSVYQLIHMLNIADTPQQWQREFVNGIVFRSAANGVLKTAPAALMDLRTQAAVGAGAWKHLDMSLYRAHNWQCFDGTPRQPYASIYSSLGCPYQCSFCCINAPFKGQNPLQEANRYRMRPPIDVVTEIMYLYRTHGVRAFKMVDEMFVLNERHYKEICNLLIAAKQSGTLDDDLNIWAYARVDTIKPERLDLLRAAGFKWLAIGIESASAFVRDGAQKHLRIADIEAMVRTVQRHDINVIANYIFGLPDDTQESMQETLDMALRLNTEFANFYSAMAYPGSALYNEAVRHGWTLPPSWRAYSQHNYDCRPLDTQHVPAADVLRFRDYAFQAYFTNPAYLDMIERRFGIEAVEHIKQMTTIHLPRRLIDEAVT